VIAGKPFSGISPSSTASSCAEYLQPCVSSFQAGQAKRQNPLQSAVSQFSKVYLRLQPVRQPQRQGPRRPFYALMQLFWSIENSIVPENFFIY